MDPISEFGNIIGSLERRSYKPERLQIYEGRVEYTADPMNRGRVKVRVAGVYDPNEDATPIEKLPWALPCVASGSFNPAEVGDTVAVFFRKGDPSHPVYLGTIYGLPDTNRTRGRASRLKDPGPMNEEDRTAKVREVTSNPSNNDHSYTMTDGNEAPEESFKRRTLDEPGVSVLKRSQRGHTILMNDETEKEELLIIDRLGQILAFKCAVKKDENKNNKARRKHNEEYLSGKGVPLQKAVGESAQILLIDAKRQSLILHADGGGSSTASLFGAGGFLHIEENPGTVSLVSKLQSYLILSESVQLGAGTGGLITIGGGIIELNPLSGA